MSDIEKKKFKNRLHSHKGNYLRDKGSGSFAPNKNTVNCADNYCLSKIKGDTKISPDIHKIFVFFL